MIQSIGTLGQNFLQKFMSDINVLVLGANGMLGKMVSLHLNSKKDINLSVTSRTNTEFIDKNFNEKVFNFHLTSEYSENLKKILSNDFDSVVNCIGVIKPKIDEFDSNSVNETINTNSYFPLELQNFCNELNIRYIQIGTDCVFSGEIGQYAEDSFKDPKDLYGKSKIVGEVEGLNKYIIRSSIIGPEKGKGFSLMNWFLNNEDSQVSGFKNHLWNGVTTLSFAKVAEGLIRNTELDFKTQHLVPKNLITKANLLEKFKSAFNKEIDIKHIDAEQVIDRTLKTNFPETNKKLWKIAGYDEVPSIEDNIEELFHSKFTNEIMK